LKIYPKNQFKLITGCLTVSFHNWAYSHAMQSQHFGSFEAADGEAKAASIIGALKSEM
jgi:hypothetical protein